MGLRTTYRMIKRYAEYCKHIFCTLNQHVTPLCKYCFVVYYYLWCFCVYFFI